MVRIEAATAILGPARLVRLRQLVRGVTLEGRSARKSIALETIESPSDERSCLDQIVGVHERAGCEARDDLEEKGVEVAAYVCPSCVKSISKVARPPRRSKTAGSTSCRRHRAGRQAIAVARQKIGNGAG